MPRTKIKACGTCGRKHRSLTRRQCLLGKRSDHRSDRGALPIALKAAVFLRDSNQCQHCGGDIGLEMSHVIRKGQCGRLKFDLVNVKLLCSGCHIWWHQNEVEASQWFVETWPMRWEYLQAKRLEYRQDPGTIPIQWYFDQLDLLRSFVRTMEAIKEKGL